MAAENNRGLVFPSPVVMLSIVAVVMAAVAFVATRDGGDGEREIATPVGQQSTSPTESASPKPKKKKPIKRGEIYVEVLNNTNVQGLAADVGGRAGDVGWNVVATDNWVAYVPGTTVYHPPKLKRAAKQLALDLGVDRTAPAEGAMKLDRLTLILTGPL